MHRKNHRILNVVADDREAESGTLAILQSMDRVEVQLRRLPLGDYSWDGGLLFERKTLTDFAASLASGRLLSQAFRLASARQQAILILEGTASDLRRSRMRREAIQGALISISVLLGIPILRSKDAEETARLMLYTARQVGAVGGKVVPRPARGRRVKGKHRVQLAVLQGVPGIGPERACRLVKKFGSLQAVFDATSEELSEVNGIGADTAEKIRWAMSDRLASYRPSRSLRHP